MPLPSTGIRPIRTASAPVRTPRRTPTLAPGVLLVRVRGVMDRRRTRYTSGTSDAQPTSPNNTESKSTISTFPDLVLQIMRGASTEQLETLNSGDPHIPHVQAEGGKMWEVFNNRAMVLEKDLQKFQDAVKELGSSLALAGAARNMRKSISLTSLLFQENAKNLFPQAVSQNKLTRSTFGYSHSLPRSWPPPITSPNPNFHVEPRPIYVELKAMADSVERLRLALEQFLEFSDREEWPLMSFEGDLNYWSSCLEHYEGQFESREVQMYIHDLSGELGTRFEDVSLCLKEIIDSVPAVRLTQEHFISNLQNLATIATFFSAVTATILQYSFMNNDAGIARAVNLFWFNSLVFSIASALNSFLVLTWRRANYSSPRLHIPWWLWIWIRQCPPVFLLVSVITFLVGLGCFTVSSGQVHYTSVIVIISEAFSAFGLAALLVWLAYDKWTFHRQRKTQLPVFRFAKGLREKADSILPTHHDHTSSSDASLKASVNDSKAEPVLTSTQAQIDDLISLTSAQRSERARKRWGWAFRKVIFFLRVGRKERGKELLDSRRMDKMDARLCKLAMSHQLERHDVGAETNDIQFDPQGRALAICGSGLSIRFDLDSAKVDEVRHLIDEARQVIWTTSAKYLVTRKRHAFHVWPLSETQPYNISANSRYILHIPVPNSEMSVNDPPKLLSVETVEGVRLNKLVIVDISGKEHMVKEFKDVWIQHLDILPDGKRALVAAVIPHVDGNQLSKASPVRKLMVFNLQDHQTEYEVPLWHEVQYVTLSIDGRWAVVTYKNYPPPQLWLLQGTPHGVRLSLERQFCARERLSTREFDPSRSIRFTGRGHFLGRDRYILCSTVDGKIHIWRRDKAHPIHVHCGLTLDKDKPVQIACNGTSDDFMFATRSHDGTIRIWKAQQEPPVIRIDTTRLPRIDPGSPMGPTRVITLSPLSESPLNEQPGATDIDSVHPDELSISNAYSTLGQPYEQHRPALSADSGKSTFGMLSESPQGSPSRERPPDAMVDSIWVNDGGG